MKKENEKVLPYSQNRKLGFKNLGIKLPTFPRFPSFRPGHHLYGSVETLQYSDEILWKESIHVTPFSKEIFFIYFEHNRNSIESYIHVPLIATCCHSMYHSSVFL